MTDIQRMLDTLPSRLDRRTITIDAADGKTHVCLCVAVSAARQLEGITLQADSWRVLAIADELRTFSADLHGDVEPDEAERERARRQDL